MVRYSCASKMRQFAVKGKIKDAEVSLHQLNGKNELRIDFGGLFARKVDIKQELKYVNFPIAKTTTICNTFRKTHHYR